MKTNKLMHLLALGLALTFTATGCRKDKHLTPLPKPTPEGPSTSLPTNPPYQPEREPEKKNTDLPTWDPRDFNQDRTAFAAETVHFDYDSPVVKQSEMKHLEVVAAALRRDGSAKLLIEGHCDERGTEEYNRSLGERRALALREELAKLGIDQMLVRTLTFGEDQPADRGHDESAWRKNRRGVFVLLHPK